jgi:pimeloyl-ACP methyl ester carboxylesterase
MPASSGYVATDDGVRLFFETRGQGPRMVVVPNGPYLVQDFEPLADGRTLVFYDLRNRGRSDAVADAERPAKGILDDVEDLDSVRRYLGLEKLDLIGHSYVGFTVVLYAIEHPEHAGRIVQIGPLGPFPDKQHPPELSGFDQTRLEVFAKLAALQKAPPLDDPVASCRRFWSILRFLYVTDPKHAHRVDWGRCELPNERNSLKYFSHTLLPSIRALALGPEQFARAASPVLTIHGERDRSAPLGGGRDWAELLPDARLVAVESGGHAPWIENPELVFGAIRTFLDGRWPEAASKIGPGSR